MDKIMTPTKARILIVDDDTEFLRETHALLSEQGYETLTCPESRKALSMIEERRPSCVLLDLRMPALDGQDLLLLIRRKHPDLPVIICTGISNVDERYLLKSGASDVLQKPFSYTTLFSTIEQATSQEDEMTPVVLKGFNLRDIRDSVLSKIIVKALARTNFNVTKAAGLLGVSRQCLLRYIKRLQISY